MTERLFLSSVLMVAAGLAWPAAAGAQEAGAKKPSIIFNLINRPAESVESRDEAFNEAIKRDALAPRPSPMDEWEPQPDGSMRNKKSGVSITVRNPCPAGDIEHEFALAAYNRAMAGRSRR
ncbi:MAG: hypothetical protein ACREKQ_12555 [Candidatus Rokuibacteriota bacterium]